MRRKIAAILAADIAGYSRLIAEDEEETVRRLSAYREVFDDFIKRSGGRIFNTAGDSVLAEFPSAVDALRCAIDVQETLRTRNLAYPTSRQMAFRMGMTIGDVVEREGDLLGDGVNIAARLQTLSKPGSVCLSKAVYDSVANKVSVKYVDMGPQEVKNIPYPVHAYSVTLTERPVKPANDAGETTYEVVEKPKTMRLAIILLGALVAGAGVAFLATKFQGGQSPTAPAQVANETPSAGAGSTAAPAPSSTQDRKTSSGAPPKPAEDARTKPVELAAKAGQGAGEKLQQKAPASPQEAPNPPPAPKKQEAEPEKPPAPEKRAAEPKAVERDVAAIDTSPDRDVAATMRLRQNRWSDCNGSDLERALDACTQLSQDEALGPIDRSTANRSLALAYRKNGKLDDAVASYTKSIEIAASPEAYDGRGISHLLKSETEKALKDFDQAIKLDDKAGDSYNNRAWAYYKLGRSNEALQDANKAVDLIPDKADAWDTRAHIYEQMGDKKKALADFERANSLDRTLQSAAQGVRRLRSD